jgi:hypothetical protein
LRNLNTMRKPHRRISARKCTVLQCVTALKHCQQPQTSHLEACVLARQKRCLTAGDLHAPSLKLYLKPSTTPPKPNT